MSIRFEYNLHFDHLHRAAEDMGPEALTQAAEHVGEVSAQLVPIEEGTLLRSQKIEIDSATEASISYNTVYARYQHERLDLRHEHGQAKYLEQPMITEEPKVLEIIAEHLRRML